MQSVIKFGSRPRSSLLRISQVDGNYPAWKASRVCRAWAEAVNTRRWSSGHTTPPASHRLGSGVPPFSVAPQKLTDSSRTRAGMESDDEDLRAAITASLKDAPSPPKAKNDKAVVDLTEDTDDDVVQIYPKSRSVISLDASREASAHDNAGDNEELDEDLKQAIALSLQAQASAGREVPQIEPRSVPPEPSRVKEQASGGQEVSKPEPAPVPSEQTLAKEQAAPRSGGVLGLDRKQMEEERLARLAKRKAETSGSDEREAKHQRSEKPPQGASRGQASAGIPSTPSSAPSIQFPEGTVKKTFAFGHRRSGDDIKIEEVLQSSDLELCVLSSFMWDIDWLFGKLNLAKNRLLLVMQAKTEAERQEYTSDAARWKSLRLCFPPMDGQINCMHSKLMLLFHSNYVRIAVPTANLTPFDWGEQGGVMENSVFIIDLPKKDTSTSDSRTNFYNDLVYFLKATTLHENIIAKLDNFDFSKTAPYAFVHSIGGPHIGTSWKQTGYCGLGRSITALGLQTNKPLNIDFVTSSLGSLTPDLMKFLYLAAQGDNGLTELTLRTTKSFPTKSPSDPRRLLYASTAEEWKDRLRIYYPSEETIRKSKGGPNSAGTICFNERFFENGKFPKHVLRDCVSAREGMVMHNKIIYVQPDEPIAVSETSQCRGWAYVGSANSSESAWGRLVYDRSTKQPKLNCRNWECGVVIPVIEEQKSTNSDAADESGSETEEDDVKEAKKAKGTITNGQGAKSKGKEENGDLLDVFRGTVPVPMRLPGQKLGSGPGAKKPWYGAFE